MKILTKYEVQIYNGTPIGFFNTKKEAINFAKKIATPLNWHTKVLGNDGLIKFTVLCYEDGTIKNYEER